MVTSTIDDEGFISDWGIDDETNNRNSNSNTSIPFSQDSNAYSITNNNSDSNNNMIHKNSVISFPSSGHETTLRNLSYNKQLHLHLYNNRRISNYTTSSANTNNIINKKNYSNVSNYINNLSSTTLIDDTDLSANYSYYNNNNHNNNNHNNNNHNNNNSSNNNTNNAYHNSISNKDSQYIYTTNDLNNSISETNSTLASFNSYRSLNDDIYDNGDFNTLNTNNLNNNNFKVRIFNQLKENVWENYMFNSELISRLLNICSDKLKFEIIASTFMNDEVFKLQNNKISINNKASISNPSNIFSSANGVQNPLRFDHKSVPYHLFTHSTIVIHLIRHLLSFGIKNSLTLKKSLKQLIILICLSLFNLYFKTREIILKVYLQICYNRLKSFIILNNNFDSSIVKLLKIYKDSNNDNLNSILSSNQNINNTVPAAAAATTATTPTKVTNTTTATNTSQIRYPKRKLQNSKMYTTNLLSNLIISFNNKTQNIVKFIDPEFLEKYLNIYQLDLISSNSNNNESFNNSNINVNNFNLVNQSHNSNINDLKFITMLNYNDSFDEPSKSGTFTTIPQVSNNVTTTRLKPLRLRSFSSDYTNNSFYSPSLSDSNPSSPVISSPNMPLNLVNASNNSIYNNSTKPASSSINCPLNQTYNKIPTTSPPTARNFTIPTNSNRIQNQFKHQRHKSSAVILNRNRISVSEQPENIPTNNAIERGNESILPVNIFRLYSNFQTIRKFFMCVLLSIFEKYIENKTNALTNQSRLFLNVLLKTFNLEHSAVLNSNQSSLKYLSIFNSLLLIIKLMEKFMLLFEAYIRELNEDELLSIPFGNLQQQQRQQSTSSTLSSVSSLSRNSNLLHTIVEEDLDSKEYIFRYLMKLTDEISNKLAFMQIQNQNRNDNDFSYNPNYPNNSERINSYSTVDNSFNLENLTKIGDDINNLIDNYNDSILLLQQQVSKENELKNVELSSSNKQFNLNPSFSIISTNEDKSNPKRYSKESNDIDKRDSIGLNLNLIKVFDDSLNLQDENINTDINNNNRFSYNSATSSGYNTVVIHSNVDDNELNDNPQFSQNNKDDFKKNLEKLVIRQSSGFNDNQGLGLNNTELGQLVNNNTAISSNLNSAGNGLTASKIKRRSLILAGSNIDSPYEDDEDIEKEFEKNIINVGVSPLSDTSSYSFQKASHTVASDSNIDQFPTNSNNYSDDVVEYHARPNSESEVFLDDKKINITGKNTLVSKRETLVRGLTESQLEAFKKDLNFSVTSKVS